MPKVSPEKLLANAIDALRSERAALMSRVSAIDASFGRLGIAVAATVAAAVPVLAGKIAKLGKRRGRPPGSKNSTKKDSVATKAAKPPAAVKQPVKKRKRRTFAVTGDESILAFIKEAGQPNAAEVNVHWKKEGRAGTANTPISKLLKDGKLKRIVVEGERGARYAIA